MRMQISKMLKESVKLRLSVENELPEVGNVEFLSGREIFIMGN